MTSAHSFPVGSGIGQVFANTVMLYTIERFMLRMVTFILFYKTIVLHQVLYNNTNSDIIYG